jgi:hypothetical protein
MVALGIELNYFNSQSKTKSLTQEDIERHGNNNSDKSLQSHFILTMSHWSNGLPFASRLKGPRFNSPGGYLCETGILLLAVSRYIGDPDVIDHHGLV